MSNAKTLFYREKITQLSRNDGKIRIIHATENVPWRSEGSKTNVRQRPTLKYLEQIFSDNKTAEIAFQNSWFLKKTTLIQL